MNGPEKSARTGTASLEHTIFMERPPIDMPVNLAEWVAPVRIAHWIRQAIAKLDPSEPAIVLLAKEPAEPDPQAVLSILVFCYLTQRFQPKEIFAACLADADLKELCAGRAPDPDNLEHFRRNHREVLKSVLGQVLVRAVQEHFHAAGPLPPGLEHGLFMRAIDQLDTARHMSQMEE